MTTFTTEDRILAEKDGSFTINVEGGTVTASPPHIVDSGASVMNNEPVAWVIGTCANDYRNVTQVLQEAEEELEHYKQFGHNNEKIVPLYTHPAKELTDAEIKSVWSKIVCSVHMTNAELSFARTILKKAKE
jgi:S-adenosylmethionine:tRNA-ribosyltransferase-isomerase (queuine synthetase)